MKAHLTVFLLLVSFTTSSEAAITYFDATPANTTLADGSVIAIASQTGSPDSVTSWVERTGFANGGAVLASRNSDDPVIRTTVGGGTLSGDYNVTVYFWIAGFEDDGSLPSDSNLWDISAGLTEGGLASFDINTGAQVLDATETTLSESDSVFTTSGFSTNILAEEGNRRLYAAQLGVQTAVSGNIQVFVDEINGDSTRTWFDGVGVEAVPEPTSVALLSLAGAALVAAGRRRD